MHGAVIVRSKALDLISDRSLRIARHLKAQIISQSSKAVMQSSLACSSVTTSGWDTTAVTSLEVLHSTEMLRATTPRAVMPMLIFCWDIPPLLPALTPPPTSVVRDCTTVLHAGRLSRQ